MTVTTRLYNHTSRLIQNGSMIESHTYKVNLYTSLTFNSAHSTMAQVNAAATPLISSNGYTSNTTVITATVSTTDTDDSKLAFSNPEWTATGGDIGPAEAAVIFNNTLTNDPPVGAILFGGTVTAINGTPFRITFNENGFMAIAYTAP